MLQAPEQLDFAIKTDIFEGPLELLIELVEKRKLLINDISLATVTDEYMARVAEMQERSLPNTSLFISLAATLLLIKSKSLLPILELTKDEEEIIEDLEERLKLYQIYRNAAQQISTCFGTTVMYERNYAPDTDPLFVTDSFTATPTLVEAAWRVLQNLPKAEIQKPKVQVKKSISLEEMMDRLALRIRSEIKIKFSQLIHNETEKKTIIVGFLAILESVKQGSILAEQARRYDDIHMEGEGEKTPFYG